MFPHAPFLAEGSSVVADMNKARSDGGGVVLPGRDSYRVNWSNVGRSSGLDRTDDEFLDREGWNRET